MTNCRVPARCALSPTAPPASTSHGRSILFASAPRSWALDVGCSTFCCNSRRRPPPPTAARSSSPPRFRSWALGVGCSAFWRQLSPPASTSHGRSILPALPFDVGRWTLAVRRSGATLAAGLHLPRSLHPLRLRASKLGVGRWLFDVLLQLSPPASTSDGRSILFASALRSWALGVGCSTFCCNSRRRPPPPTVAPSSSPPRLEVWALDVGCSTFCCNSRRRPPPPTVASSSSPPRLEVGRWALAVRRSAATLAAGLHVRRSLDPPRLRASKLGVGRWLFGVLLQLSPPASTSHGRSILFASAPRSWALGVGCSTFCCNSRRRPPPPTAARSSKRGGGISPSLGGD